jgi:hypothetical protein
LARRIFRGALYIFAIVKNKGTRTASDLRCNELRSWTEVHRSVRAAVNLLTKGSAAQEWSAMVAEFLALAEQLVFTGFGGAQIEKLPAPDLRTVFYTIAVRNRTFAFEAIGVPPIRPNFVFYQRR